MLGRNEVAFARRNKIGISAAASYFVVPLRGVFNVFAVEYALVVGLIDALLYLSSQIL